MSKIVSVIQSLPTLFVKEKAKGWDRVIVFDLKGEEPVLMTVVVKGQELTVHDGQPTEAEAALKLLTITGESQYVCQMFLGEVPPMKLVNAKLIQMKGSIIDSMSFSRIWNLPKKY